ncbi:MAG TPA: DUF72 domain-containing protein [Desulfosalsimonadaceae bacterium]|nr:DUF72 domain-containing protein [Desulfosalsimonadaceae bacterium]
MKLHIGTSGWNYKHWRGPFYPEELPANKWREYYMERFHTVEVNNTFYQLPDKKTFEKWKHEAERGFIYALKASRYITHMKKLKDPHEPVNNFLSHAAVLEEKLGPVLFQLPPRWRCNPERLGAFLEALPGDFRYVLEFRDDSWWKPEIRDMLRRYNAACCVFDLEGVQSPPEVTADFAYIRLHGPEAAYQGQYPDSALNHWAKRIRSWLAQGIEVFCYFDNDENGYAAQDALRLAAKTEAEAG